MQIAAHRFGNPGHLSRRKVRQIERKLRPVGLVIDRDHWPDFYDQFGDRAILFYGGRLDLSGRVIADTDAADAVLAEEGYVAKTQDMAVALRHAEDPIAQLVLIFLHRLTDNEVSERLNWLQDARAFHALKKRPDVQRLVRWARDPAQMGADMANRE